MNPHKDILAALLFCPMLAGCFSTTSDVGQKPLVYQFSKTAKVSTVRFPGIVQASQSLDISLKEGVGGVVRWLKDEGSQVASGDLIATIDMDSFETELESHYTNLRHSREQISEFLAKNPTELERIQNEALLKERNLEGKIFEDRQLHKGKPDDERQRAAADLSRSHYEVAYAHQLLEFQKNVSDKGFDTPFALRKSALEAASKEIEKDYNQRRIERLQAGPLPEEMARAAFQIDVASGERWLAGKDVLSASAARAISRKTFDFNIDIWNARVRETEERLSQREIRATKAGMLIHPILWGSKVQPGSEVWEGLVFLKVISTGSYLLDAAIDENLSSVIKTGASATVFLDSVPEKAFQGIVSLVGKVPRRNMYRRSDFKRFPVQISVELGSLPVRVGQKGTVVVEVGRGEGVFLPRDLVAMEGASASVRLWRNGSVATIPANIENFDGDTVKWLDPPEAEGELAW